MNVQSSTPIPYQGARPVTARMRQHLRALARHVNRASAAHLAATALLSQLRKRAADLRDQRMKMAQQLQGFIDRGTEKSDPSAIALGTAVAEIDMELSDCMAEIEDAAARCTTLVSVYSPLNEQLTDWMRALSLGASEIGLADTGPSLEHTQVIDVSQIAARAGARGGEA